MSETFVTPQATYIALQTLRSGAAGATYRVEREGDASQFILKTLTIGKIADWKAFDLFEREVATLKAIDHPQIPGWIDSHLDEESGVFVHVQACIEGISLEERLDNQASLSAFETEHYLRQCLALLDYLHTRSPPVVHRDIKPSNLMLCDQTVHMIDFGAVKVGRRDSTSMTTVGTFGFMAPEQILGRAEPRSDLYGLGMTFVCLATGCSPAELPVDPQTGQIDPRDVLSVPPHVARVLLAMIRPGLAERPADARTALALLDATPTPAVEQPGVALMAQPRVDRAILTPYDHPAGLSEVDKNYLRGHRLQHFPVWAAVLLHFMTFGLFSLLYYGSQHGRLPKATHNDPSAAKGVGCNFVPYFNFYWVVFSPLRLVDRVNLQHILRDREAPMSRGFMMACAIMGAIPYLNLVLGVPLWGAGVVSLQRAINTLADERATEPDSDSTPALPQGLS